MKELKSKQASFNFFVGLIATGMCIIVFLAMFLLLHEKNTEINRIVWSLGGICISSVIIFALLVIFVARDKFRKITIALQELSNGDYDLHDYNNESGISDECLNEINIAKDTMRTLTESTSNKTHRDSSLFDNMFRICDHLEVIMDEKLSSSKSVLSAIEQMVFTVVSTSDINTKAKNSSEQSRKYANNGLTIISETLEKIKNIEEITQSAVKMIQEVEESCEEIEEMVSVIRAIADQTNLLALNAAIEAARAGDHGRGFAVVADEVRSLATNTTKATEKIEKVVSSIRNGVKDTSAIMLESSAGVKECAKLVDKSEMVLSEIVQETESVLDIMIEVASAGDDSIESGTDKIAHQLESLADSTMQAEGLVNDATENIGNLRTEINKLID